MSGTIPAATPDQVRAIALVEVLEQALRACPHPYVDAGAEAGDWCNICGAWLLRPSSPGREIHRDGWARPHWGDILRRAVLGHMRSVPPTPAAPRAQKPGDRAVILAETAKVATILGEMVTFALNESRDPEEQEALSMAAGFLSRAGSALRRRFP